MRQDKLQWLDKMLSALQQSNIANIINLFGAKSVIFRENYVNATAADVSQNIISSDNIEDLWVNMSVSFTTYYFNYPPNFIAEHDRKC